MCDVSSVVAKGPGGGREGNGNGFLRKWAPSYGSTTRITFKMDSRVNLWACYIAFYGVVWVLLRIIITYIGLDVGFDC